MPKKNDERTLVTFSVTLEKEKLASMSVAERKNAIETAFTAEKELAIAYFA